MRKSKHRLLILLHGILLIIMFSVYLNLFIKPSQLPVLNFIAIGLPILLVFNFLLLLIELFVAKKMALVFFVIGLLLYPLITPWMNCTLSPKEKSNFKIMTANVGTNYSKKDEIEDLIKKSQVDFIFLQESQFFGNTFLDLPATPFSSECYFIKNYSKYPLKKVAGIVDTPRFWGSSFYTDIIVKKQPIRCINIHLETTEINKRRNIKTLNNLLTVYQGIKDSFIIHEIQVEKIKKVIEQSPYPVILAGDFNAAPNSYEYFQLSKKVGLEDAFVKVGNGLGGSFFDILGYPLRIDYVFHSPSIQPISYAVDKSTTFSDHQPVFVEFKIK